MFSLRRTPERDQWGQEPSGESSSKRGPELEGQRREEVFRSRQERAEQMRWGITLDQLYKGCHEHRDSAVARRELDERSGKSGEADGVIQETDCSHRGFTVAFALAVPSAGNTLPSQRHVVGSTSVMLHRGTFPRHSCYSSL